MNARKPIKPATKPAEETVTEAEPVEPIEETADDHSDPSILRIYGRRGILLSFVFGKHSAVLLIALSILAVLIGVGVLIAQLIRAADALGLIGVVISFGGILLWTIGALLASRW